MTPETWRRILVTSFLGAIVVATYSELHDYKRVPRPARYVGAGILYGLLGLVAPLIGVELAGLFGLGMFLALLYQHYQKPPVVGAGPNLGPQTGPPA